MKGLLLLLIFWKLDIAEGNKTLNHADYNHDFYSFVIRINEIQRKGLVEELFSNIERDNSTDKCSHDLKYYRDSIDSREDWAISLLDSSGFSFTGLLSGNTKNFGNYKQCLSTTPNNFSSSYCLVEFTLSNGRYEYEPLVRNFVNVAFMLCLPDTCNDKKIGTLLEPSTSENNTTFSVQCHSRSPGFTYGDAFGMLLFVLIWIVIISTTLPKKWIPIKTGVFHQIWDSFSLRRNLAIWLKLNTTSTTLMSLDGLRVLSQYFIVWFHIVMFGSLVKNYPILNFISNEEFYRSMIGMIVLKFSVAVDTYFVVGGVLLTWNCLEKKKKFNLLSYYIHRYLRLTPPYLAIIIIFSTFYNKLCEGPLCSSYIGEESERCAIYWWTNLIYINNIYPGTVDMCVSQSWYLAADWQLFFFISPFVVIVINKCPQHLYKLLSAIFVTSVVSTFLVSYLYDLPTMGIGASIEWFSSSYMSMYVSAYRRAGPWTIGMFCGAFLHNVKKKTIKLSKKIHSIAWLLTALSLYSSFENLLPFIWIESAPTVWRALFNAIHPMLFSISISWIIFSSETRKAGFIGRFLRWPVFQPLSKLSYSVYLCHMLIINLYLAQNYGYNNITAINQIPLMIGITFTAYAVGLLLYLSFEVPTAHLDNILLRTGSTGDHKRQGMEGNNSAKEITTVNMNNIPDLESLNEK